MHLNCTLYRHFSSNESNPVKPEIIAKLEMHRELILVTISEKPIAYLLRFLRESFKITYPQATRMRRIRPF